VHDLVSVNRISLLDVALAATEMMGRKTSNWRRSTSDRLSQLINPGQPNYDPVPTGAGLGHHPSLMNVGEGCPP